MDGKKLKNKNQTTEKREIRDTVEHAPNLSVNGRKVQVMATTTATAPRNEVTMTDRSKRPLSTADDGHKCSRLFVGNLPKAKTAQEIFDGVSRTTRDSPVRVTTYKNFDDPSMHRGFCFLDYESAAAAANAKRTLSQHKLFGCTTIVDWAKPRSGEDTVAKVRVLFVRQYGGVLGERVLARKFGRYGAVERVNNVNNYAFVHFERREDAQAAMYALDGCQDVATGVRIDVAWAKSPADKQTRQQTLRNRERRLRKSAPRPQARVVSGANGRAASTAASTTSLSTNIVVTTSDRDSRTTGVPFVPPQRPMPNQSHVRPTQQGQSAPVRQRRRCARKPV